jgi:hypothetical protein
VSGELRDQLRRRLRPQPEQARRLAALLDREGALLPRDYWSELALLAVWKGGTVSLYLPRLVECFGPAAVRDIGLIASEGRMSIPLSDTGSAGVLDLMHQFFEFIPEDELGKEQPTTLLAHQVAVGERYYLVLTTSGGFYRYSILDHVEVVDFYRRTPVIEFLNKGAHISSLTGEKLTENQVVRALERVHEGLGLGPVAPLTLTPVWAVPPYYVLLVAEGGLARESWSAALIALEQELCLGNLEYAQKRKSGRLGPLRLRLVPSKQFAAALGRRQKRLRTPEQVKHIFLVPDLDYHERFQVLQELTYLTQTEAAERSSER